MWIKFCGMTREQDVRKAYELGADAVGFIFAASPRKVTTDLVKKLSGMSQDVLKVGVFVNERLDTVRNIRKECQLDIIQLHGDESPTYCQKLGGTIIKAFRAKEQTMPKLDEYSMVWKFLLDAFVPGQYGGSGKRISSSILDSIESFSDIIIAGGLDAAAALEIEKRYSPFGVDINSGVELAPGIKDHQKMQDVIWLLTNEDANAQ
jgi:phosphoribosylanthranilate isomerase